MVVPKLGFGIQEGSSYQIDYKHEYPYNYKADHILYATSSHSILHPTFNTVVRKVLSSHHSLLLQSPNIIVIIAEKIENSQGPHRSDLDHASKPI